MVLPMLWCATLLLAPGPTLSGSPLHARVRPLSDVARAILDEALRRSPTIQQLVIDLQQGDTIVYIELAFGLTTDHGTTSLVKTGTATRMLRVVISATLAPARRLEVLGHELSHALEIAREPSVRDVDGFRTLYRRIGYQMSPTSFETDAARAVEQRVRAELSARR